MPDPTVRETLIECKAVEFEALGKGRASVCCDLDPVRESIAKATAAMFAAAQSEDAGAEVVPIKVVA